MPALVDPLPRPVLAALRSVVLDHVSSERRRRFPPVLHVGRLGGASVTHETAPSDGDLAWRTDVVAALVQRCAADDPVVWLTRSGALALHDVDAEWLAAARAAYAEADRPLTFLVVTRRGWWDPCSDLRREWRRLRPR